MLTQKSCIKFIVFALTWPFTSYANLAIRCSALTVAAIGTGTTCEMANGSINATASGGTTPYSYSLDGINFQSSGVFSNLQALTYTITAKDALGATSSTTLTLTNTYVTPQFQYLPALLGSCTSTNGSFTLNPYESPPPYLFSLDNINYQASGSFSNLPAGDYMAFMRDGDGCMLSAVVSVVNNCPQQFSYRYANPGCSNSDGWITLSQPLVGPPVTFSFNGGPYVSAGTFNNLAAGIYTIQVKDNTGLIQVEAIPLYYNCTFSVSGLVTNANCGQNDGTIRASVLGGIGPFQYSIDGINYSSSPNFNNLAPGVYVIHVKDPNGLISIASATVGACATVSAVATSETCGEKNGTITANGAGGTPSYLYSLDATNYQTDNLFKGLAAGAYTVTIKDALGNLNTTDVTVEGTTAPALNLEVVNPTCKGDDGSILVTASSQALPVLYNISGSSYQADNNFKDLAPGQYTVTAKDADGCISTKETTLSVTNTLTISTGNNLTICQGTDTGLTVFGNGARWSWTPTTGLDNPASSTPNASPSVTTTYYVTETLGSCDQVDSQTVFVNPAPTADAGPDVTTCYGKDVQLHGVGGLYFYWSPSLYLSDSCLSDPIVNKPINSETYYLSVVDGLVCKSIKSGVVNVYVTPQAKLFAGDDTAVIRNQPLQLHAIDVNNSGFSSYTWWPPYGLDNPAISDPTAVLSDSITYMVTATTPDGCESMDTIHIAVYTKADILVPNAFTPNGDGRNDVFRPVAVGIKNFNYFVVYNRWGQQIFKSSDPGTAWDGRLNGEMQLPGTYVWLASGVDYQGNLVQRKGTVILIR